VAASTAIRATNPELVAARILDIPVLGRAQLLALLMAGKDGIAVAGTHGKTTTTGMVVAILEAAGLDPSFAVGGDFKASGVNAASGRGPHFEAEADESDGSFLELAPTVAVVTNVEPTTSTTGATWRRRRRLPVLRGPAAGRRHGRALRDDPARWSWRGGRLPGGHLRPSPPGPRSGGE
jgi:UDP-N-acetylmuramate--alanine ligase